jgi:hypothetical protein
MRAAFCLDRQQCLLVDAARVLAFCRTKRSHKIYLGKAGHPFHFGHKQAPISTLASSFDSGPEFDKATWVFSSISQESKDSARA